MAAKKKPAGKAAAKIQKAKAQQWTRHRGDKAPVALGVYVEVRLRNGATMHGQAGEFEWRVDGKHHLDIMAWRRVRKPRSDKGTKAERSTEEIAKRATELGSMQTPAEITDKKLGEAAARALAPIPDDALAAAHDDYHGHQVECRHDSHCDGGKFAALVVVIVTIIMLAYAAVSYFRPEWIPG